MTNVLASEAASGVPTRRSDMIAREAVEAQADEVAWDCPRSENLPAMGLRPSMLGAATTHFLPGVSLRGLARGNDLGSNRQVGDHTAWLELVVQEKDGLTPSILVERP